ncbi:MAG: hypothetical protein OER43_02465 [Gammaproteobacteria bacterium]|nr:hypothetical protein [Gammaproteobacteria bacterium]
MTGHLSMMKGEWTDPLTLHFVRNPEQLYWPPMNADDSKEVMNNGDERW